MFACVYEGGKESSQPEKVWDSVANDTSTKPGGNVKVKTPCLNFRSIITRTSLKISGSSGNIVRMVTVV